MLTASGRQVLSGRPGAPGIGWGAVLRVEAPSAVGATSAGGPAADPAVEVERLRAALERAHADLDALAAETADRAGAEVGAIFEAQALFARDPGLVEPAVAAVRGGRSAGEAIEQTAATLAEGLAALDDDYFRERAADVRDVGRRVAGILTGRAEPDYHHRDGRPAVLVGEDLEPSAVAGLRAGLVAGLALAGGAPNGHTAIVARALGVPLVLGLGEAIAALESGSEVLVDGGTGRLVVAPDADEVAAAQAMADLAAGAEGVDAPPLPVRLEANVGSAREAEDAARRGADGIGLVRTELLFLGRAVTPGLDEQASLYRRIRAALPGRPVVFRTLDVGGDKPADYAGDRGEPNPALGVRGLRLGLRDGDLLETQLRALLEVAAGETLDVLFPMVATVEELEAAREALDRARASSVAAGRAVASTVRVGVMIEVPSAALLADALAPRVDFFSVGTNDLVQYTLAADRTNPALADLAVPLQPAVLRLIHAVCGAAAAHGRPVAVCGEAAADPEVARLLIGLGVDELSVAPAALAPVRAALAGVDVATCRALAQRALAASTVAEVRALLDAEFPSA